MSIHFPSSNNAGLRARSSFLYTGEEFTVFGHIKCVAAATSANWYRQLVCYEYGELSQMFAGIRGDGAGQPRALATNVGNSSVDANGTSAPSTNTWYAFVARHRRTGDPKRVQFKFGSQSLVTGAADRVLMAQRFEHRLLPGPEGAPLRL